MKKLCRCFCEHPTFKILVEIQYIIDAIRSATLTWKLDFIGMISMFRLNDWLLAVSSEKKDALFPNSVSYVFQKCSYIL